MSQEEYSLEIITDNHIIEIDTSSDNLSSSAVIEISDPVFNIVEVSSNDTTSVSSIVGLEDYIKNIIDGVINNRTIVNIDTADLTSPSAIQLNRLNQTVFVNTDSSNATLILPQAAGFAGGEILIKNIGNNTISVLASGTETIDGQSSFNFNYSLESFSFVSNNNNWYII